MALWGKKASQEPVELAQEPSEDVVDEAPPRPEPKETPVTDPQQSHITIIRAGLHLTGKIETTDAIYVEGSIEGEVIASSVTVTEGATLSGTVSADFVRVLGTIQGKINCITLRVDTTGHVEGEVVHSVLVVEAGATIEGTVARRKTEPKATFLIQQPTAEMPRAPAIMNGLATVGR